MRLRRLSLGFAIVLVTFGVLSGGIISPTLAQPEEADDDDGVPIEIVDQQEEDEDSEVEDTDDEEQESSSDSELTDDQLDELPEWIDEEEAAERLAESEDDEEDEEDGTAAPGTGEDGTEQIGTGDAIDTATDSSAGAFLDGTASWVAEGASNFIVGIFAGTYELAVGTPVPENAGWMGLFGEPTNEPFASLFTDLHETWLFPLSLSFFLLALLISASVLPFSGFIGRYSASKWILMAFVTILAISLSWPIVTAMHALSDTVGAAIAPSGEELTQTNQGLETLVASAGPTAAALYFTMGVKMVLYALIYGMRYFLLLMVMPYIFGLAVAVSIFAPWTRLRSFGSMIVWQYVGLLIMAWPMALLFRAAYIIEWGFTLDGLANLLLVMGALVAGVVIPVVIAYQMTKLTGTLTGAVRGAGASMAARESYTPKTVRYAKNAPSKAREIGQSARAAPSRARDRVTALRGGDLNALRPSFTSGSPSAATGSGAGSGSTGRGSTQAERKQAATDGGSFRTLDEIFNERNQTGNRSSGGAD